MRKVQPHHLRAIAYTFLLAVVAAVVVTFAWGIWAAVIVAAGLLAVSWIWDWRLRRKAKTDPRSQEVAPGVFVIKTPDVEFTIPADQIGAGASVWAQGWRPEAPTVIRWEKP